MSWSSASQRPSAAARRRLLLALVAAPVAGPSAALLGGCGFRPLYAGAEGEAVAEELAAIEVRAPLTRLGRILESRLIDDLDPAGLGVVKRYRLDLDLEQSRQALAIQLDDSITRFDLTLAAFFSLRETNAASPVEREVDHTIERDDDGFAVVPEIRDGTAEEPADHGESEAESDEDGAGPLFRSAVRRVASYNVVTDPFATLIAEQDAERRAAVEVSRVIRTQLTIFFETAAG